MASGEFSVRGIQNNRFRIEPTEIQGIGGPIYPRLIATIHFDLNPGGPQQDQAYVLLSAECGLFLTDQGIKIADAAQTTTPTPVRNSGYMSNWNLEFPFDQARLKAVEAKRHGDLKLRFDLAFVVALLVRSVLPEKTNQGPVELVTGFERASGQAYVEVPQSHWVGKVLPQLGQSDYFVVEIPTTNGHVGPALELIQKAENAFNRWDTRAVFAHCREAATALTNIVDTHHKENSFARAERWERAIKEFNHFASLHLHLEGIRPEGKYASEEVRIEKPDAECLLIFTKALAKYAEELVTT